MNDLTTKLAEPYGWVLPTGHGYGFHKGPTPPVEGVGWKAVHLAAPVAQAATPAPADRVPMPTNADQAAAMALLGEAWLRENAPERLKAATPAPAPAEQVVLTAASLAAMATYPEGHAWDRLDAAVCKRAADMLAATPAPAPLGELLTAINDAGDAFTKANAKCTPPQEWAMDLLADAIGRLRNAAAALAAAPAPEPKPLTDAQIVALFDANKAALLAIPGGADQVPAYRLHLVRMVEHAHGIGQGKEAGNG